MRRSIGSHVVTQSHSKSLDSEKTSIKLFPKKMQPLPNSFESIYLCDLDTERIIPIPKM